MTKVAVPPHAVAAATLALLLAATFMPSPLYELYRREWGLTPAEISIVFAIYAGSLIPSLLFLGGLSDRIGRKNTMLLAVGIMVAGSLLLAFAGGLWWLVAARIVQGVAMGIGTGTAAAAVREWIPPAQRDAAGQTTVVAVSIGSAAGALIAGCLGEFAPWPTTLPYLVEVALLAGNALLLLGIAPEAHAAVAATHRGLPEIPAGIRRPFYTVSAQAFVGWAAFAMLSSLVPSFLSHQLGLHNLMVGASVITGLQFGSLFASFAGRAMAARTMIVAGLAGVCAGLWMLIVAASMHGYVAIAIATVIVGTGGGLTYLAGLNVVNAVAPAERRAEITSAFLVACYLGFSVPALGVGIGANVVGLFASIETGVALLTAAALVIAVLPLGLAKRAAQA